MADNTDNIAVIRKADSDLLSYFTNRFSECSDSIDASKTELFELNIRLDELSKTRSIYSLSASSSKDPFTPNPVASDADVKESQIDAEMKELIAKKKSVQAKIAEDEAYLRFLGKKLRILKSADISIKELSDEMTDKDERIRSLEREIALLRKNAGLAPGAGAVSAERLDELKKEAEESLSRVREEYISHNKSALLLIAFDQSYIGSTIDRKVNSDLAIIREKLETLRSYISKDPRKAKQSASSISKELEEISLEMEYLMSWMHYSRIDGKSSFTDVLNNYINSNLNRHPEVSIESDLSNFDTSRSVSYITAHTVLTLIDIFFDNIYKHSKGNRIIIRLSGDSRTISAYIKDNGIGISDSYMTENPWYSGLHKASEILFMIGGKLDIKGTRESGTTVRFSVPY